MIRRGLSALLLACAAPLAAQGAPHAEPGCATISDANLPADFAAWAKPAEALQAAADRAAPVLPLGQPVDLVLKPSADVQFAAAPEQKRAPENAHAGLVKLKIPAEGIWRVAASGPVWIDMLSAGGPVASTNHGRMAPCTSLRKVVEFPLTAGEYLLQLSGNPGPELRLMVARKP